MDYYTKPTFTKDELIEINKRKAVQKAKNFIARFRMQYPTNAVGVYENFDNIPEEDVKLYKEAFTCLRVSVPEKAIVTTHQKEIVNYMAVETAINTWLDSKNNRTVYSDYRDIEISYLNLPDYPNHLDVFHYDLHLKFYYATMNKVLRDNVTLFVVNDASQNYINKTVADQLDEALEKISTASIF